MGIIVSVILGVIALIVVCLSIFSEIIDREEILFYKTTPAVAEVVEKNTIKMYRCN